LTLLNLHASFLRIGQIGRLNCQMCALLEICYVNFFFMDFIHSLSIFLFFLEEEVHKCRVKGVAIDNGVENLLLVV